MAESGPSRGPQLVAASPLRKYVAVKRKANEEPSISQVDASISKRFKLVASAADKNQLRQVVKDSAPMLVDDQAFVVEDLEEFILKVKPDSFPKANEVVTCNGVPLVPIEALTVQQVIMQRQNQDGDGLSKSPEDSEAPYVYDVYWYSNEEDQENELVSYAMRQQETYEEDLSSNDEDHPYNQYPDEESESDEEYGSDRIINRSPIDDYLCREDSRLSGLDPIERLKIDEEGEYDEEESDQDAEDDSHGFDCDDYEDGFD